MNLAYFVKLENKRIKNTNIKIDNKVERNFYKKNHEYEILAVDATYISVSYH